MSSNRGASSGLTRRGPRPPDSPPDKEVEVVLVNAAQKQKRGPRPPSGIFDPASMSYAPKAPSAPKGQGKGMKGAEVLVETETGLKRRGKKERRMSDFLRGRIVDNDELEDLLYDKEYRELEEEKPANFPEKLELMYKKKIHEKKACQRALVCALAVSLLWASSLAACRLLVSKFVPSPTYDEMEEAALQLNDTVVTQRKGYKGCVDEVFEDCLGIYIRSRDVEINRVESLQDVNKFALKTYSGVKQSCANTHDLLISGVDVLRNLKSPDTALQLDLFTRDNIIDENTGAVLFECDKIDEISRQQIVARHAVEIGKGTADASNTAVDNFTQQLNERIAYDLDYFGPDGLPSAFDGSAEDLRNKLFNSDQLIDGLNSSFLELQRCLTGDSVNGTQCPNSTTLFGMVNELYNDYNADFERLKAQAQNYQEQVAETAAEAQALANKAQSIYDAVGGDIFGGLPPPWTFPDVDLSEFDAAFSGDFLGDLGISQEEIERRQQEAQQALMDQLGVSAEELEEMQRQIEELQNEFAVNISADYDPPPVDINASNINHQKNAEELAQRMSDDLGYVQNQTPDQESVDRVISQANQSAANLLTDVKNREYDVFSYPDVYFRQFKFGFRAFTNYAVLFDTVYRIFRSAMLIKKYWSISGISTPPADVRSDAGALFKAKKSIPQLIAMVITHPLIQLLNTTVWIVVLTVIIYKAYEPLYGRYVEGCVQHNALDIPDVVNGTMIFRNLYTTTLNLALSEGDKAVSQNIDALNLERQFSCREYFGQAAEQRAKDNNTFLDLDNDMQQLVERFNLYNSCVRWTEIDAEFNTTGRLGITLEELASVPVCRSNFAPIDISDTLLFNCTSVTDCQNTCVSGQGGVNIIQMREKNHNTACTVEWGLHAYFLSGLFATAIYICVNIARFYFMRAVIAIWWKQISLDLFSYLGSCTKKGTIIPPKRVTEDGEEFSKVIKEKLDIVLRKFARGGYIELGYAIVVNVPWIVFISIISQTLEYQGNEKSATNKL